MGIGQAIHFFSYFSSKLCVDRVCVVSFPSISRLKCLPLHCQSLLRKNKHCLSFDQLKHERYDFTIALCDTQVINCFVFLSTTKEKNIEKEVPLLYIAAYPSIVLQCKRNVNETYCTQAAQTSTSFASLNGFMTFPSPFSKSFIRYQVETTQTHKSLISAHCKSALAINQLATNRK